MTNVIPSENCGNSPKNLFAQDLAIALALNNVDFLLDSVSSDIRWRIVGGKEIQGKDALTELFQSRTSAEVALLTIHHVVTHGKAGAVNGTMAFKDESAQEFCDIFEFTSAKGTSVKTITSYVIARDRD